MRKLLALMTATVALGALSAAAAPGAGALTLVTCSGTNGVTYAPALTNTTRSTTITSTTNLSSCSSLTHPTITSGAAGNQISGPASCTSLLGSFSSANTITWNTGQTSTFTFTGLTEEVDGQYVITLVGSITSGLFTGAAATEETTLTGDLSLCAGAGLSSNSGPSLLQIVGL